MIQKNMNILINHHGKMIGEKLLIYRYTELDPINPDLMSSKPVDHQEELRLPIDLISHETASKLQSILYDYFLYDDYSDSQKINLLNSILGTMHMKLKKEIEGNPGYYIKLMDSIHNNIQGLIDQISNIPYEDLRDRLRDPTKIFVNHLLFHIQSGPINASNIDKTIERISTFFNEGNTLLEDIFVGSRIEITKRKIEAYKKILKKNLGNDPEVFRFKRHLSDQIKSFEGGSKKQIINDIAIDMDEHFTSLGDPELEKELIRITASEHLQGELGPLIDSIIHIYSTGNHDSLNTIDYIKTIFNTYQEFMNTSLEELFKCLGNENIQYIGLHDLGNSSALGISQDLLKYFLDIIEQGVSKIDIENHLKNSVYNNETISELHQSLKKKIEKVVTPLIIRANKCSDRDKKREYISGFISEYYSKIIPETFGGFSNFALTKSLSKLTDLFNESINSSNNEAFLEKKWGQVEHYFGTSEEIKVYESLKRRVPILTEFYHQNKDKTTIKRSDIKRMKKAIADINTLKWEEVLYGQYTEAVEELMFECHELCNDRGNEQRHDKSDRITKNINILFSHIDMKISSSARFLNSNINGLLSEIRQLGYLAPDSLSDFEGKKDKEKVWPNGIPYIVPIGIGYQPDQTDEEIEQKSIGLARVLFELDDIGKNQGKKNTILIYDTPQVTNYEYMVSTPGSRSPHQYVDSRASENGTEFDEAALDIASGIGIKNQKLIERICRSFGLEHIEVKRYGELEKEESFINLLDEIRSIIEEDETLRSLLYKTVGPSYQQKALIGGMKDKDELVNSDKKDEIIKAMSEYAIKVIALHIYNLGDTVIHEAEKKNTALTEAIIGNEEYRHRLMPFLRAINPNATDEMLRNIGFEPLPSFQGLSVDGNATHEEYKLHTGERNIEMYSRTGQVILSPDALKWTPILFANPYQQKKYVDKIILPLIVDSYRHSNEDDSPEGFEAYLSSKMDEGLDLIGILDELFMKRLELQKS